MAIGKGKRSIGKNLENNALVHPSTIFLRMTSCFQFERVLSGSHFESCLRWCHEILDTAPFKTQRRNVQYLWFAFGADCTQPRMETQEPFLLRFLLHAIVINPDGIQGWNSRWLASSNSIWQIIKCFHLSLSPSFRRLIFRSFCNLVWFFNVCSCILNGQWPRG